MKRNIIGAVVIALLFGVVFMFVPLDNAGQLTQASVTGVSTEPERTIEGEGYVFLENLFESLPRKTRETLEERSRRDYTKEKALLHWSEWSAWKGNMIDMGNITDESIGQTMQGWHEIQAKRVILEEKVRELEEQIEYICENQSQKIKC